MVNWLKKLVNKVMGIPEMLPMAGGADTSFNTLTNDAVTYIADKTLMIAHKVVRFYEAGDKAKLPSASSKTFQYTRYDRLALPQTALTEGTTPTATALAITTVTAVAEQWGATVRLTDVAELTIRHKPLQKGIELLGYQAAETIEREIYNVVAAGTSVYYPGTVTARSGLGTSDFMDADLIGKVVANLRDQGAYGVEKPKDGVEDYELGDLYLGICDSFVEQDISSDPDFIDANKYAAAKRLWNGEVGTFKGVRFVRSNMVPTFTSAAGPTPTSPTGGSFTNVAHDVIITGVDDTFGYEKVIYQTVALTPSTNDKIDVTVPATAGFKYNVYITPTATSTDATTALKVASLQAPSTAVSTAAPPTTGATVPAALASATAKMHQTFFVGKEAYTVVDLQTLQATLTANIATDGDPLKQRRTIGWKTMFKAVINNENFLARAESASAFD